MQGANPITILRFFLTLWGPIPKNPTGGAGHPQRSSHYQRCRGWPAFSALHTALVLIYLAMAVEASSKMYCWGNNQLGALGIGSTANVGATAGFSMTEVGTPSGLSSLGILQGGCKGGLHGCAMVNVSGIVKVFCWGLNGYGQLGIGSTSNVGDSTPFTVTEVQGLSVLGEVRQMHCGGFHTCATVRNAVGVDKVVCWGHNNSGQLGVGSTTAVGDVPGFVLNEVLGLADKGQLVVMEAGLEHNCTIVRTGGSQQKVYCWGLNNFGQVGVGSTINVGYVPGFTLSEVSTTNTCLDKNVDRRILLFAVWLRTVGNSVARGAENSVMRS